MSAQVVWKRNPQLEQRAYELGATVDEVLTTSLRDLEQVVALAPPPNPRDEIQSVVTVDAFTPKEKQDCVALKRALKDRDKAKRTTTETETETESESETKAELIVSDQQHVLKPMDVIQYMKLDNGLQLMRERINRVLKWAETRGDNVTKLSLLVQQNVEVLKPAEVEAYRKKRTTVKADKEQALDWLDASLAQLRRVLKKRQEFVDNAMMLGDNCQDTRKENKQIEMMIIAYGDAIQALRDT
jgi:hypothetical protein